MKSDYSAIYGVSNPFEMALSLRSYELPPGNIELIHFDSIPFMSTESYKLQNTSSNECRRIDTEFRVVYSTMDTGEMETCHQIISFGFGRTRKICCFSLWGSPSNINAIFKQVHHSKASTDSYVIRTFLVGIVCGLFIREQGKKRAINHMPGAECADYYYHEVEHIETTFSATHRDYLLFAPERRWCYRMYFCVRCARVLGAVAATAVAVAVAIIVVAAIH